MIITIMLNRLLSFQISKKSFHYLLMLEMPPLKPLFCPKKDAQHLPDWTYFVMHNISQQHLTTAKYLYLTLVLGYRYRHTEQYKKNYHRNY